MKGSAEKIFPKKEEFEFDLPKNNLTNLQPILQDHSKTI